MAEAKWGTTDIGPCADCGLANWPKCERHGAWLCAECEGKRDGLSAKAVGATPSQVETAVDNALYSLAYGPVTYTLPVASPNMRVTVNGQALLVPCPRCAGRLDRNASVRAVYCASGCGYYMSDEQIACEAAGQPMINIVIPSASGNEEYVRNEVIPALTKAVEDAKGTVGHNDVEDLFATFAAGAWGASVKQGIPPQMGVLKDPEPSAEVGPVTARARDLRDRCGNVIAGLAELRADVARTEARIAAARPPRVRTAFLAALALTVAVAEGIALWQAWAWALEVVSNFLVTRGAL